MVDQMGLAARALLNHIGPLRCLRIETIKSVIHKTWLSIQLAHIAVNVFSFLLYFSREREIWRDRGREREGTNKTPRYLFHYTVSATRSECSGHSLLLVPNELLFLFFFFSVEFSGIRFLVLLACRLVAASSNSVSSLQEFHEFHVLLANLQRTFREFLTCDGTHTQTLFMCWANERDSVTEWACQARGKVLNGISAPSFNSAEVHHIKVWFCSVCSFLFAEWQRWRHFYVRIEYECCHQQLFVPNACVTLPDRPSQDNKKKKICFMKCFTELVRIKFSWLLVARQAQD